MERISIILMVCAFVLRGSAEVRVFIEDIGGTAWIKYECTDREVVRAFALDVSVDRGRILGVTNFLRGPSKPGAPGYGIFPASFRDHITVNSGANVNWDVPEYSPLAEFADKPGDTLPGLNSSGVTLEFGALWDPAQPEAVPGPEGTLCALQLSGPAVVSLAANASRGGVVSAYAQSLTPVFMGAAVGPAITSFNLQNGVLTISFKGGELQTAASIDGVWVDTGNSTGSHSEVLGSGQTRFFRVRALLPP